MARITVEDCLDRAPHRFELARLAARRAQQRRKGAPPLADSGNKQAEERFKEISVAHDVLTDPSKRKLYDEFGMQGLQSGFDPAAAREYKRWAESGHGFSFRGGEGFDFENGFGQRRRRRSEAD